MKNQINRMLYALILVCLLVTPQILVAQSMTGFLGQNEEVDKFVEKLRETLVETHIDPLEAQIDEASDQIEVLSILLDHLNLLWEHAYRIYSVTESPFNKLLAHSSDDGSFTATANKNAQLEDHKIQVKQMARGDRFRSNPIESDTSLPGTSFTIASGEDQVEISFPGGTLSELAELINSTAGETIAQSFAVQVEPGKSVLTLSGLKTGKENALRFSGDLSLLYQIGVLSEGAPEINPPTPLISSNNMPETEKGDAYELSDDNVMTLKPRSQVVVPIPPDSERTMDLKLEMDVMQVQLDEMSLDQLGDDFAVGSVDGVQVHEWQILDLPMIPTLGIEEEDSEERLRFLSLQSRRNQVLQEYHLTDEALDTWITYSFPVGLDVPVERLEKILLYNNYNARNLKIRGIRFSTYDESASPENLPDYHPANPLDQAQDAIVSVDGVDATRPSNVIDDVIPGVTLFLEGESEDEETLSIEHDVEELITHLLNLRDAYNLVVQFIYNVALRNAPPPRELERQKERWQDFSAEEREYLMMTGEYYRYVAKLRGDNVLETIKSRLREAWVTPYPTRESPAISMVFHIGFKDPNYIDQATGQISDLGRNALRTGTIDVNREALEDALKAHYDAVRELFFFDTDDDNRLDSGVAYKLAQLASDFKARYLRNENGSSSPGLVWAKIEGTGITSQLTFTGGGLKGRIRQLERQIAEKEEWIDDEVEQTRRSLLRAQNQVAEMNRMMRRYQSMTPNPQPSGQ